MTKTELQKILKAGDVLAYYSKSFFGLLISVKTWHKISHTEVYIGDGKTVTSTVNGGVGIYDLDMNGLVGVYRPKTPFNLKKAMDWYYKEAVGQKYDWKGILGFTTIVKGGDRTKQFCSELCTRFLRKGGVEPFAPREDADKVAPFQLTISPVIPIFLSLYRQNGSDYAIQFPQN